jgi:hypothetical protein
VTPPDRRPAAEREIKRVAPADGDTKTVPHNPEAGKAAE